MKKSLVLAMAMALGVTASAYAASPFSDVPAGHWAYDSIAKLAASGVIEGYGDGTFRGDRLMTRFEMAQIVAKAMAKGANVNKLAAEFADELDALGIRVAALEKKSDNVKITGQMRIHYAGYGRTARQLRGKREHGIRTRIWFTGKINDNWKYTGRIQNQQWTMDQFGDDANTGWNIAKLEGRLGGMQVMLGRDNDIIGSGNIYDAAHDAIKLKYGDKVYISGALGRLTDANEASNVGDISNKFYNIEIGTNLDSALNGKVGYFKADTIGLASQAVGDVGIFYVGADWNINKDLTFSAEYLRSNRDNVFGVGATKKSGYVFGLAYKGADPAERGSWGLAAKYYNQGRFTYLQHTIDGFTDFASGFKGWSIGGDVTVAKNMVFGLTYYDTKALKSDIDNNFNGSKAKVVWGEFNAYF